MSLGVTSFMCMSKANKRHSEAEFASLNKNNSLNSDGYRIK